MKKIAIIVLFSLAATAVIAAIIVFGDYGHHQANACANKAAQGAVDRMFICEK